MSVLQQIDNWDHHGKLLYKRNTEGASHVLVERHSGLFSGLAPVAFDVSFSHWYLTASQGHILSNVIGTAKVRKDLARTENEIYQKGA